jgi:hypothetical protein
MDQRHRDQEAQEDEYCKAGGSHACTLGKPDVPGKQGLSFGNVKPSLPDYRRSPSIGPREAQLIEDGKE